MFTFTARLQHCITRISAIMISPAFISIAAMHASPNYCRRQLSPNQAAGLKGRSALTEHDYGAEGRGGGGGGGGGPLFPRAVTALAVRPTRPVVESRGCGATRQQDERRQARKPKGCLAVQQGSAVAGGMIRPDSLWRSGLVPDY